MLAGSALIVSACGASASDGARTTIDKKAVQATASYGCTQEDAPALIIHLTTPESANEPVTIEAAGVINRPLPLKVVLIGAKREMGTSYFARAYLGGEAEEPRYLSGEFEISTLTAGNSVTGKFDFAFPDGAVAKGDFAADWTPGAAACG